MKAAGAVFWCCLPVSPKSLKIATFPTEPIQQKTAIFMWIYQLDLVPIFIQSAPSMCVWMVGNAAFKTRRKSSEQTEF